MEVIDYIQRRRKRYLAQTLDEFERLVLPHLPPEATPDVDQFKSIVRQRMNALAIDAAELIDVGATPVNGYALEVREGLAR